MLAIAAGKNPTNLPLYVARVPSCTASAIIAVAGIAHPPSTLFLLPPPLLGSINPSYASLLSRTQCQPNSIFDSAFVGLNATLTSTTSPLTYTITTPTTTLPQLTTFTRKGLPAPFATIE